MRGGGMIGVEEMCEVMGRREKGRWRKIEGRG